MVGPPLAFEKGGDVYENLSDEQDNEYQTLRRRSDDLERLHKVSNTHPQQLTPKASIRGENGSDRGTSSAVFRSQRFIADPLETNAMDQYRPSTVRNNAPVAIVAAEQVEDPAEVLRKEELRSRRKDRCCLFCAVFAGLLANTVLISAVLLAGFCLIGQGSSCSTIISTDTEDGPKDSKSPSPSTLATNVPTQSSLETTLQPYPTVPASLPFTLPGEFTPSAMNASTVNSPAPVLEECRRRNMVLTCKSNKAIGSSCDDAFRIPATFQCSLGKRLRSLTFSYHPLKCNPYGTSQSDNSSKCVESPIGVLSDNPVKVSCNGLDGESLVVSPDNNILPGNTLQIFSPVGNLPEKIQCIITDTTLLQQTIQMDASGNVTLSLGDIFGSLVLVSCVRDTSGVELSCLRTLDFNATITNMGPNVLLQKAIFTVFGQARRTNEGLPDPMVELDILSHFRNPLPQSVQTSATISVQVHICELTGVDVSLTVEIMDHVLPCSLLARAFIWDRTGSHGHSPGPPPFSPTQVPSSAAPPPITITGSPLPTPHTIDNDSTSREFVQRTLILGAIVLVVMVFDVFLVRWLWRSYQSWHAKKLQSQQLKQEQHDERNGNNPQDESDTENRNETPSSSSAPNNDEP